MVCRRGLGFRTPWGGLEQAAPKDPRGSGDSTRDSPKPGEQGEWAPGSGLEQAAPKSPGRGIGNSTVSPATPERLGLAPHSLAHGATHSDGPLCPSVRGHHDQEPAEARVSVPAHHRGPVQGAPPVSAVYKSTRAGTGEPSHLRGPPESAGYKLSREWTGKPPGGDGKTPPPESAGYK